MRAMAQRNVRFVRSIRVSMFFIFLLGLLGLLGFHQVVEVLADAGQVEQPAAVNISPATKADRLDLAFSDEVVEGSAFDAENSLHILPASKFGHSAAEVTCRRRCQRDLVFNHASTIGADLLPGHQAHLGEQAVRIVDQRTGSYCILDF